jgi:hypothetical protein
MPTSPVDQKDFAFRKMMAAFEKMPTSELKQMASNMPPEDKSYRLAEQAHQKMMRDAAVRDAMMAAERGAMAPEMLAKRGALGLMSAMDIPAMLALAPAMSEAQPTAASEGYGVTDWKSTGAPVPLDALEQRNWESSNPDPERLRALRENPAIETSPLKMLMAQYFKRIGHR